MRARVRSIGETVWGASATNPPLVLSCDSAKFSKGTTGALAVPDGSLWSTDWSWSYMGIGVSMVTMVTDWLLELISHYF